MKYWKQLYDEDVACLVGDSKVCRKEILRL